jgi:polysaccharide deacetylase family sporulation protein PdaB
MFSWLIGNIIPRSPFPASVNLIISCREVLVISKIYVRIVLLTIACCLPFCSTALSNPKKDRFYFEKRGEVVWEVPTDDQIVALTFDDGPDPENTELILDLLKQYNAKATFFLVGSKVERNPELVRREVAEGHELANHTYSHIYFDKGTSITKIKKDITRAEEVIFSVTGQKSHLFRPPGGIYNEKLVQMAKQLGYIVVLWSWHQDSRDWDTPGVHKIVNSVLNHTQKGDIVLFHEYVEGQTQTIEALKQILPELKQRGYRFVTVSELLTYRKTKTMDNKESNR